jgi:hypothetical protein
MSPLASPVLWVSTVRGGGPVLVSTVGGGAVPMTLTGPGEHPDRQARAPAQATPATRTAVSGGRDGRLPLDRRPRLSFGRNVIMNLRREPIRCTVTVSMVAQRDAAAIGGSTGAL